MAALTQLSLPSMSFGDRESKMFSSRIAGPVRMAFARKVFPAAVKSRLSLADCACALM